MKIRIVKTPALFDIGGPKKKKNLGTMSISKTDDGTLRATFTGLDNIYEDAEKPTIYVDPDNLSDILYPDLTTLQLSTEDQIAQNLKDIHDIEAQQAGQEYVQNTLNSTNLTDAGWIIRGLEGLPMIGLGASLAEYLGGAASYGTGWLANKLGFDEAGNYLMGYGKEYMNRGELVGPSHIPDLFYMTGTPAGIAAGTAASAIPYTKRLDEEGKLQHPENLTKEDALEGAMISMPYWMSSIKGALSKAGQDLDKLKSATGNEPLGFGLRGIKRVTAELAAELEKQYGREEMLRRGIIVDGDEPFYTTEELENNPNHGTFNFYRNVGLNGSGRSFIQDELDPLGIIGNDALYGTEEAALIKFRLDRGKELLVDAKGNLVSGKDTKGAMKQGVYEGKKMLEREKALEGSGAVYASHERDLSIDSYRIVLKKIALMLSKGKVRNLETLLGKLGGTEILNDCGLDNRFEIVKGSRDTSVDLTELNPSQVLAVDKGDGLFDIIDKTTGKRVVTYKAYTPEKVLNDLNNYIDMINRKYGTNFKHARINGMSAKHPGMPAFEVPYLAVQHYKYGGRLKQTSFYRNGGNLKLGPVFSSANPTETFIYKGHKGLRNF